MQQVSPQKDRCVFREGKFYYKVFFGATKTNAYQREAFIGKTLSAHHTNQNDHIMKTTSNQYTIDDPTKTKMLAVSGECATAIQNESLPLPLVQTEDTGGQDLYAWLQSKGSEISKETIRKFAFQLAWLVGEMQSQFGIQHNDIQETNIKVKEIAVSKTLVYQLNDTFFEVPLVVGDLEVILIDFGSATLKKQERYDENPEPWEDAEVAVLQVNNCPEGFFMARDYTQTVPGKTRGTTIEKVIYSKVGDKARDSQSDLFMIGHVLLSLHLHHKYRNFEYTQYKGVHVYDIAQEFNLVEKGWNASEFSKFLQTLASPIPALNDRLFVNVAPGKDTQKVLDMFFIHLIALDVALQNKTDIQYPSYVSNNRNTYVQNLYDQINKSPNVRNYVLTHFNGLRDQLGDPYAQSFIARIMDFDPVKRCGPNEYSLTGYLFHPYFASFYKGTSYGGTVNYALKDFLPPLEYNKDKASILTKIEGYEQVFNDEYLQQEKDAKKKAPATAPAAPTSTTPAPAPAPAPAAPSTPAPAPAPATPTSTTTSTTSVSTKTIDERLQDCIEFINQLQNPEWANTNKLYEIQKDELQIVVNTQLCINLAFELAKNDPNKLAILERTKMVVKKSDGTYETNIADTGTAAGNNFTYLTYQKNASAPPVFQWVNMANNGAYLAVGLYATKYSIDLPKVNKFIDNVEKVRLVKDNYGKVVQDVRDITRATLKEFWPEKKGTGGGTTVVPVLPAGPAPGQAVLKPKDLPELQAGILIIQKGLSTFYKEIKDAPKGYNVTSITKALSQAQKAIFKQTDVDMSDFDNIYWLRQKLPDNNYKYPDFQNEKVNKWKIQMWIAAYSILCNVFIAKLTNPMDPSIIVNRDLLKNWFGVYNENGDQTDNAISDSATFKKIFTTQFQRDLKLIDTSIETIQSSLENIEHIPKTQEEINNELYIPLKEYISGIADLQLVQNHLGLQYDDFKQAGSIHGTDMSNINNQTRYLHTLSVLAAACKNDQINMEDISKCFDMWPPTAPYQLGKVNEI